MAEDETGFGQQYPEDSSSEFNKHSFAISRALALISTAKIVKVTAVDTAKKTVTVRPLVKMIDGTGNTYEHGDVSAIPYWQWQMGKNSVIGDPAVDDIGVMICCDRDISAVKATKAIAPPGSLRQLDISDGIYFGGLLNGDPEQWVKFTDTGLELHDKNSNALVSSSTGWEFTGPVKFNQVITAAGNLQLGGAVLAVNGSSYGGTFTGADFRIGSGGTLVSLAGHWHASNNTPPTPGH